jgi:hypothetical protein
MTDAVALIRRNDPRQTSVQRAVKVAALARLAREIGIAEALAVVATAMRTTKDEAATPRELAAAGRHAYRAGVVEEIGQLENEGRGRAAASIVARRHAADVHDPIEVETLTNKFRRWRRAEEKRAVARLPAFGSARP